MNDLTNMLSILEVCTKRGAFHAEELSGVGSIYDKLKITRDSLNKNVTDKCVGSCEPVKEVSEEVSEEVCSGGRCDLSLDDNCDNCPQNNCENCPYKCDNDKCKCLKCECDNCDCNTEDYDKSAFKASTIRI